MSSRKKHAALIIGMIKAFAVVPGGMIVDTASADTELSKPKLVNYAASGTSIKNTWKRVKGAKGYEVYRATKEKGRYKKVKTIKSGKTVSWTNKKLKKNKNYFYKVRAYKKSGSRKEYSEFSGIEWAVPTNEPNWEYAMASKTKKTSKVAVRITNKSSKKMQFQSDGWYFKDQKALNLYLNLSQEEWESMTNDQLFAKGIIQIKGKKKTIVPGKSVTLSYKTYKNGRVTKIKYTKKGIVENKFTYNGGRFWMETGWKYGCQWGELE